MIKETLSYTNTGYFSKLILDYLNEKPELAPFYNHFPKLDLFQHQIKEKHNHFSQEKRDVLSQVLKEQYKLVEASSSSLFNIENLKESNTYTITTGHQLNLFTGPLYFLYKIVSVINLTKQLKEAYPNYNFVPIYWMASEDHDFDEINYFNFKGKKIQWNKKATGAVGDLGTEGLEDIFELFKNQLGLGDNANQLSEWFEKAYLSSGDLAGATFYLANELFKKEGLVIVDAHHKSLKTLFIPHIKQELTKQTSYENVIKTSKSLSKLNDDYKIQVNPREINLFYLSPNIRERIILEDNVYKVLNTDLEFSEKEMLQHIEEYPENFSPNVILRPLYQEVILPNLCYIGGGGELAYWMQLKSNFEAFNVPFPILLLRNSALLQSSQQKKKIEKLKVSTKDLFKNRTDLITQKVKDISDIEIDFSPQKNFLKQQFEDLYKIAKDTDASFVGAVAAQERKQIKGLEHLEKRLLKAQKRKLNDYVNRLTTIQNELFPNESLQERTTNFSEFYLEYGSQLIDALLKHLEPLEQEFTILTLD